MLPLERLDETTKSELKLLELAKALNMSINPKYRINTQEVLKRLDKLLNQFRQIESILDKD